ncbi:flagellar protein FlbD [Liquorilactobacillus sucicola DSM 21376 = JCM 15457]|nr:flagellar FlbD family protein [Liquorilactobacillus sucicola]AJA34374.1 flagellar protein FlbD [Liquorilactobacillus sucicola]GAJ26321.1 flagellar protein FlbD [Liquorilactobacillus sucicola DSM 21376 = JCM 15457]
MIALVSMNGSKFYLNPDLIYRIEETPDTVVILTDGKTLIVKQSAEEIVDLIIEYRRKVFRQLPKDERN